MRTNTKDYNPATKKTLKTKIKYHINKKQEQLSRNISRRYAVFVIVFFVVLIIFITSSFWLPTNKKPMFSKRGEIQNISPTITAELMGWEYNSSAKYAEITFQITRSNVIIPAQFEVEGKADNGKLLGVKSGVVYYNNDIMIVRMQNIPKDFIYLSVTIFEMVSDTKNASNNNKIRSETSANFREDFRNITHNSELVLSSNDKYQSESFLRTIEYYEYKKEVFRLEIDRNISEIAEINKQIYEAEKSDDYLTLEEKTTLQSSIESRKKDIENLEKRNAECSKSISDLNKKIDAVGQKMNVK